MTDQVAITADIGVRLLISRWEDLLRLIQKNLDQPDKLSTLRDDIQVARNEMGELAMFRLYGFRLRKDLE